MMMECSNLLKDFETQNIASPEEISAAFIDSIQNVITLIEEDPFADDAALQREAVRHYCQSFFDLCTRWVNRENKKHKPDDNHADAAILKEKAAELQGQLEDTLDSYILCLMEITRALSIIRYNRGKYRNILIINKSAKPIEWSSGTSRMLMDAILRKKELDISTRRLALGQFHLENFTKQHGDVVQKMTDLYGAKDVDAILRPLRSLLRRGEFESALKEIEKLSVPKRILGFGSSQNKPALEEIQENLRDYVALIEKNQTTLLVDEGGSNLYLTRGEIRVNLISQMKELDQKERYLRKYFGPYLVYVQKSFMHLQGKLQVIGSVQSLVTLYISLLHGIAEPLPEIVATRDFESNILNKVDFLIGSQSKEIKNIRHLNDEDYHVYQENMKSFEEVLK